MFAQEKPRVSRRAILRAGALGAGAVLFAACGPKVVEKEKIVQQTVVVEKVITPTAAPATPVEIVYSHTGGGVEEQYKPVFDKFMAENPMIKIKTLLVPYGASWGEFNDKMAIVLAGGQQIDVAYIAVEGVRQFVARGLCVPYDDFIAMTPDWSKDFGDYSPHLSKTCVFKGKMYALPLSHMNMMMWFNTKRLKEAGLSMPKDDWTVTDFVEYAKTLTKREGDRVTNWGTLVRTDNFAFCPWLFNNGLEGFMGGADMSKPLANDPKFVEVVQVMYDLIYKHKVAPRPDQQAPGKLEEGTVSMAWYGRWVWPNYKKSGFTDCDIQFLPKGTRQCNEVGFPALPLIKISKYKNEAWKLLAFIYKRDNIKLLTTSPLYTGTPPFKSLGYSDEFVNQGPANSGKKWYEAVDRPDMPVFATTAPPDFSEMMAIYTRHFSKIFANEADIKTELDLCQKDLEGMVARRPKEWADIF